MRGQIELFALTKFAMLFFIFGLALILVSYGDREKNALCSSRGELIAKGIGSAFTQVINSPAEDERKVFPLEAALATGQDSFSKYNVSIVDRNNGVQKMLVIRVNSASTNCFGGASAGYPSGLTLHYEAPLFDSEHQEPVLTGPAAGSTMLWLMPSELYEKRSRYLILIKCSAKQLIGSDTVPKKHLFIQDCAGPDPNPDHCLSLNDAQVNLVCGYPAP